MYMYYELDEVPGSSENRRVHSTAMKTHYVHLQPRWCEAAFIIHGDAVNHVLLHSCMHARSMHATQLNTPSMHANLLQISLCLHTYILHR